MKKPWSVTTTVRNPGRLRDFLVVLRELENSEWNHENQMKYQVLLIQNRLYGYKKPQFYNNLSQDKVDLIDDYSKEISFEAAGEIFNEKDYEDPPMRGRQSLNPLKKLGFVSIENGAVVITDLGRLFLKDDFRDNLGEIFLRSFLKWQIPNPDSRDYPKNGNYDIKPFIGTLHLINAANQKETKDGNNPKGISKKEFSVFAQTLVHHEDINLHAEKIIDLRKELRESPSHKRGRIWQSHKKRLANEFLGTDKRNETDALLNNLKDYGDNSIRYFRLTPYIHIRGGDFYVDLEPRRSIEIQSLLNHDGAGARTFESKEEYVSYMSNISLPRLPWETSEKYVEIIEDLVTQIWDYENRLEKKNTEIKNYKELGNKELTNYIAELRTYRRLLQEEENLRKSQATEQIKLSVENLENIFEFEDSPILLEKLSAFGLHALNDAVRIKPNYPVGDDNEPTSTAPANTPDIECFYESFNSICEVTMLTGRKQWYYEGQPVMRHLRDFEDKHGDKPSYCLFIAPKMHRDTINTFWMAVRYEYEGQKQKIIPLSIKNFVSILKVLIQMKAENRFLEHTELLRLYDKILNSSKSSNDSAEWLKTIPKAISSWRKSLVSQIRS